MPFISYSVAYFYILLNYHLKTDYTDNKSPYVSSPLSIRNCSLLLFGRMGIGDSIYKILKLDFVFTKQGIILAQVFVNLPLTIKILTLH